VQDVNFRRWSCGPSVLSGFKLLPARLLLAAAALVSTASLAQPNVAYPTKPITILVGFPAGQATDLLARAYGEKLAKQLGQPVIVDNRPGQGGSIALAQLKRAPADGYTIGLMASASLVTNPHLYKHVGYDSLSDFAPIALIAGGPEVLVANSKMPFSTVKEFIAYAKAHPGELSYCSSGNGTLSHLAMEDFKRRAGISLVHVPYQGSVKGMTDLISGNVAVCFDTVAGVRTYLGAGRVKLLGVATNRRLANFPDLAPISESGLPGFAAVPTVGFVAPAGTPPAVVARLYAELERIDKLPDIRESVMNITGTLPMLGTSQDYGVQIKDDYARWGTFIRDSGLSLD
jgi:tripartite-type tricarboxylate transporter receptor subunit TctC